jgi:hypothetical protein
MLTSTQDNMSKPKSTMTWLQAMFAGSVTGMVEVCTTGQILWSLKTQVQQGEPVTFNQRILYRGMPLNFLSMIPGTALQVGLNQGIKDRFMGSEPESYYQQFACSFSSGAVAAVVASPTEMVMTHLKQYTNKLKAPIQFIQQYGVRSLYTGFLGTVCRDGTFTSALFALTPILQHEFKKYCDDDRKTLIPAAVTAGIIVTPPSQVFDTIKGEQQKYTDKHIGLVDAAKDLYKRDGFPGFFKGMSWRGARVATALPIILSGTEVLKEHFNNVNTKP